MKKMFIWLVSFMFQARQQLTTTESITIIIDDDSETNLETAGLMLYPV
jgi:hypothetical protein